MAVEEAVGDVASVTAHRGELCQIALSEALGDEEPDVFRKSA